GGAAAGATRQYGNISTPAAEQVVVDEGKSNIFLRGWFYLGAAGALGALLAWAICEPAFVDALDQRRWGNVIVMPLVLTLMCLGFGVAESLVERSFQKAAWRGLLVLPLGAVFGLLFNFIANVVYNIALSVCFELGVQTPRNPALWIARGFAWMVFGVAGGIGYGLVVRSSTKDRYGVLGGIIRAGLWGEGFYALAIGTHHGWRVRALG